MHVMKMVQICYGVWKQNESDQEIRELCCDASRIVLENNYCEMWGEIMRNDVVNPN